MPPCAPLPIRSAGEAARHFADGFAHAAGEVVQVAFLDGERRLLALDTLVTAIGLSVGLPLRHLVGRAMALETNALILAHNHPTGDPRPSREDLLATRALVEIARPLGIDLLDHLVFGAGSCTSFRQLGLL